MINKEADNIERIFSAEQCIDFEMIIKQIVANKIEELVNNENKVNTATSQSTEKGFEDT